ncbi:MAG: SurA N-terminal domain-containing protein [Ottowia sp.]
MFNLHSRLMKFVGLTLLFLASAGFVLLGMGNLQFGSRDQTVAEVDGQDITQTEWDNAHSMAIDRARDANPQLGLNLLDSPFLRYQSLQDLVRDRVLRAAAQNEHLLVSDNRLIAALQQDPTIEALRDENGQLDMDEYSRLLSVQGMTPESYEAGLRMDLSRRQVLGGIVDSEVVSAAQADATMALALQQREIRVVHFDAADYAARLDPDEDELKAWYEAHLDRYQAPESVDIQYIVLDLDSIKRNIHVSEQKLRDYYEQNADMLAAPEQRRASHILVAVGAGASNAEREKAKARAEQLLAQVRAAPDTFAEVAREDSDDEFSAQQGGDLGFFERDKGMDEDIAKAAFALQDKGDISDLVSTDFGYHIVQLTDIKRADKPSFDAVRARLEEQLRTQQAQAEFSEMADEFTNGVYEQPDSLEPVAQKLGLDIQTAEGVTRTPAPDASGALANPRFLKALFSADALKNRNNTEAIETGANQLASGRVTAYSAAHARSYEEVADDVRAAFVAEHGARQAREAGEQQYQAWQKAPDSATDLPDPITVSRVEPQGEPPALVEAVLRADPDKLPVFVGVDLGDAGYAVARVDKVLPPEQQDAQEQALLRARYAQLWSMAEASAYYDFLRSRYKARILVPLPTADALPGDAGPAPGSP